MFNDNLSMTDITNLSIALLGLIVAVVSLFFAFAVFNSNDKNYYQSFLKFLTKKEKKIKKQLKRKKINDPLYAEYLMDSVRFFGENFFVNFSDDGYLKLYQFKTIKGIYRHLQERLKITEKVFLKALKKEKNAQIIIRLQLFNKYNYINKNYYHNKLKNPELAKNNADVYITVKLIFDRQKNAFDNESVNKPYSLLEMESDFEFKKNMYYIFSQANKIEEKLDEEQIDKHYFFAACSIINKERKTKISEQQLEKIEEMKEKEINKK